MKADLNLSIGCVFVAVIIATSLFGLTCAQVMYYARSYPNDRKKMKSLVYILWALDMATEVISIQAVFHYQVVRHMVFTPLALSYSTTVINE